MKSLFKACLLIATAPLLGLPSACSVKNPCDDDQIFELRRCLDPPETGGAGGENPGSGATSGDGDGDGDGGFAGGDMGGLGGADAPGDGDGDTATQPPNFGASCSTQEECQGGLFCGADYGAPNCIALCGEGDPFEGLCPPGTICTTAGPASICM